MSESSVSSTEAPAVNIKPQSLGILVGIDDLEPFHNHPFKPYDGERFADMVESIRTNGVIQPIIVRPIPQRGTFEILSGHNRARAAKEAGLDSIPAIIRKGLSDEEALLVVTETNLIQRSFKDLAHSERALVITAHYDAMKKKSGYRSDLLAEIDELTGSPTANSSRTMHKLGEQHNLSKDTIARYLRINKLLPELKERLDNGDLGMRAAVSFSYLKEAEQRVIEMMLADGRKFSTGQADKLRRESERNVRLTREEITRLLKPNERAKPVKLEVAFLSRYFNKNQTPQEIEKVIAAALEKYFL